MKAVANKRTPTTKPLLVNPLNKQSKHAAVLSDSGINYEAPLSPIQVALKRHERIQREKAKSQQEQAQKNQAAQQAQQARAVAAARAAAAAAAAAQSHSSPQTVPHNVIGQAQAVANSGQQVITTPQQIAATIVQQAAAAGQPIVSTISSVVPQQSGAVVVSISQPSIVTSGGVTGGPQQVIVGSPVTLNRNQLTSQPQQVSIGSVQGAIMATSSATNTISTPAGVVVSTSPQQPQQATVVSMANLTPAQQAQLVASQQRYVTTNTGQRVRMPMAKQPLTQQQIDMIRQQALARKNQEAQAKARAAAQAAAGQPPQQIIQPPQAQTVAGSPQVVSQSGGGTPTIVSATTNTGQKVSVALTPGGALSSLTTAGAPGNLTVVTQPNAKGQQLLRQLPTAGTAAGKSAAEMKQLILANAKQQPIPGSKLVQVPHNQLTTQIIAQLQQQHQVQVE